MTHARNVEQRISLWLEEEAVSHLPDRVLDATFEQTHQLRQVRSSFWRRTIELMRSFSVMAVVGASALVLLVAGTVGWDLFANQQGVGGPTATATPRPAASATPTSSPAPSQTGFRREGEFLILVRHESGEGWDLAAQNPASGEVRTIVDTDGIVDCQGMGPCVNFVRKAEWSADGRWVAFEVSNASLDERMIGPCAPALGVWVQGPEGAPRQLTKPCDAPPVAAGEPVRELWAWSPVDARLAYVRIDGEIDELFVIEALDGTRTSLAQGSVDAPYPVESSSLEWSPDGSRIAYVDGSSVYAIEVAGGDRSLLADSFAGVIHIAWSPDSSQLLVHDRDRYRIQVMNADGSDLHVAFEGEDACCETAWSPRGDRIVYMLSIIDSETELYPWHSEVWTVAPDGSSPVEVADLSACNALQTDSLPVWAPSGTQVAYYGCGGWVIKNADGTGEAEPLDRLVWRSWKRGGLTGAELAGIGIFNR